MKQWSIPSGPAATLIALGDKTELVPTLIQNIDPANTLYIGNDPGINPLNPLTCAPLAPGQSSVSDGSQNIFGIAAPGQTVQVNTYRGVSSFFLPASLSSIGGAAIYVQATTPTSISGNFPNNSLWFNTATGAMLTWSGSAWVNRQLNAQQAIQAASILAAQIANQTITAGKVANGTLTTTQLAAAAGILGAQIANATITSGNIAANTIVAGNIAANTITAAQLAAGIVYAGIVNGTTITGATIQASGGTGGIYKTYDSSGKLRVVESPVAGTDSNWIGNATYGVNTFPFGLSLEGLDDGNLFGINFFSGSANEKGNGSIAAVVTNPGASNEYIQLVLYGPSGTAATLQDFAAISFHSSAPDGSTRALIALSYIDTTGVAHPQAQMTSQGLQSNFVDSQNFKANQPLVAYTTETWHAITLDSGWSSVAGYNIPQYRILPDGNLQLSGCASLASATGTSTNLNNSNPLPSSYRPGVTKLFRSYSAVGQRGAVQINSGGVIQMLVNASNLGQYCEIDAVLKIP